MNTYDQLALSTSPIFYLAYPDISDQSGSGIYSFVNNGVTSNGQSIISGHLNSFRVTDADYLSVTGDLGFFNQNYLIELALRCDRPSVEIPVIHDPTNSFGLYANENGLFLRLKFTNNGEILIVENGKFIKKWDAKMYIKILFLEERATLFINNESFDIQYSGTPISVSNIEIGGTAIESYSFNLDGLGVYKSTVENKIEFINDLNNGYKEISSKLFLGTSTLFDSAEEGFLEKITKSQFTNEDSGVTYYTFYVPASESNYEYFIVRTNDETQSWGYKVDQSESWTLFSKDFIIPNNPQTDVITFLWIMDDSNDDFELTITGILDKDIYRDSPAVMSLDGFTLYPENIDASIVNNPQGARLFESYYTGTLQTNIRAALEYKSIEIVFKTHDLSEKTFIFSSIDGEASIGPGGLISGFTSYLNGQLVTDLTDVVENEWYHLILTSDTVMDEAFYLNYSSGAEARDLSILLFAVYETELTLSNVSLLFSVLTGADIISVEDTNNLIVEGTTENGTAYKAYAYTWSIVGAGGQ